MRPQNEQAVSPVVGVMLMLIVVIIIAAIVSGYAGSLVSSNNKAPEADIQGTYSASSGILQMYHAGGDELATQKVFVILRLKDEEAGGYLGSMSRTNTNKSNICNAAGTCWLNATTGLVDLNVWTPGQTMYYTGITPTGSNGLAQTSGFTTSSVGQTFTLEVDTIDGKVVSRSDVRVGP
jgi:FlaG/FlaF family flagellin (archaellin)